MIEASHGLWLAFFYVRPTNAIAKLRIAPFCSIDWRMPPSFFHKLLTAVFLAAASTVHIQAGTEVRAGDSASGPGANWTFVEQDGRLVIESENFARSIARQPPKMQHVHYWSLKSSRDGYSGDGYLLVSPDEYPEHGKGPSSPRDNSGAELLYHIRVETPGIYHIWVRGMSMGGESNGVHVGLDGELPEMGAGSNMSGFRPHNQWVWENKHKEYAAAPLIEIPAGEHTLHIWQRDDAFRIDKILLEIDRASAPEGKGPRESERKARQAEASGRTTRN